MQTLRFDLEDKVSVPLKIEDGIVTVRVPGTVKAAHVTKLGTRYRVAFVNADEVLQEQEFDDAAIDPAA